jgi:hypothetical protein
MSNEEQAVKLKHFQLALSMVGISANIMTCELIKTISARCDEMGEDFTIREANRLANEIAAKYNQPPGMPHGMKRPAPGTIPQEIQDLMDKGQIIMGKKEPELPLTPTEEA